MGNEVCEGLIKKYEDNFILAEMVAAVNGGVLGKSDHYLKSIFNGVSKSPVEIQRRFFRLFEETRDTQYLGAFNEYAIRAQRHNQWGEILPISETYPEFLQILDKAGLTLEDLKTSRDNLLSLLAKADSEGCRKVLEN
ncbi:MAG: hypothetical protein KJ879_00460 [Nanoarchaeota archaeon]|nr:hypothetical protein [Nanoarchaeota archaeon]